MNIYYSIKVNSLFPSDQTQKKEIVEFIFLMNKIRFACSVLSKCIKNNCPSNYRLVLTYAMDIRTLEIIKIQNAKLHEYFHDNSTNVCIRIHDFLTSKWKPHVFQNNFIKKRES